MILDKRSSDHMTHGELHLINQIGQWHSVAFFSGKIIPLETCYETHNQELMVIIEAFQT